MITTQTWIDLISNFIFLTTMSRVPYTPEYSSSSDKSDTSFIGTLQLLPTQPDFSAPATPANGTGTSYTFEAPSSRPVRSSPIVSTQAERKAHRMRKGARKRAQTLQAGSERRRELREAEEKSQREAGIEAALDILRSKKIKFGDLMKHVFDPANGQGNIHWHCDQRRGVTDFNLVDLVRLQLLCQRGSITMGNRFCRQVCFKRSPENYKVEEVSNCRKDNRSGFC